MYCYENPDDNASSRDVAGEITAKGALSALHYDHGAVLSVWAWSEEALFPLTMQLLQPNSGLSPKSRRQVASYTKHRLCHGHIWRDLHGTRARTRDPTQDRRYSGATRVRHAVQCSVLCYSDTENPTERSTSGLIELMHTHEYCLYCLAHSRSKRKR